MSTTPPPPQTPRERPVIGIILIAAAIVVIIAVVARLPGGAPARRSHHTGTTTSHGHTVRIGVVIELASGSPGHGSTTTTSPTRASGSGNSGSSTTTSTTPPSSGVPAELRARGYVITALTADLTPPKNTEIEYIPGFGGAAHSIAQLLGVPVSRVTKFVGVVAQLPAGTDVVVILGKSA